MHVLPVYVKEGLPFARDLFLEYSVDSYSSYRLALLHSVSYFFLLYWSPFCLYVCLFDTISCNINEVLPINPSLDVFVFEDFNIHCKVWLGFSGGTDRFGELCNNPKRPDSVGSLFYWYPWLWLSQSCSLGFIPFIWCFPSIAKFLLCGCLSFHWLSVKLKSGWHIFFIAFDYSCADWDCFHDHLRDIQWEDIKLVLLLLLVHFLSGFRLVLIYISFIINVRSSLMHLHGFQLPLLLP